MNRASLTHQQSLIWMWMQAEPHKEEAGNLILVVQRDSETVTVNGIIKEPQFWNHKIDPH